MSTENWQMIAVAVMLIAMPLLAWGGNEGIVVVSVIGAAVLAIGAGVLTVLRFVPSREG